MSRREASQGRSHPRAIRRPAQRLRPWAAWLGGVGVLVGALLLGPPAAGASVVYLYDDLGRLARVIREDGEAGSYHYDSVGNVLRVTRESGLSRTTTLAGASVSSGAQGATVPLTLTGSNLIGASVVCTTPGLTVQNIRTDFEQITLDLVIDPTAPLGPVQCEVRGITSVALAFSVTRSIPAFLAAPGVSVQVAAPRVPVVGTSVSVQVAAPTLVVDRSVLGTVSVEVEAPGSPLAATAVAITLEPVVTSVSPGTGAPATPSVLLRILGAGFGGATSVNVLRNNAADPDITVVTFSVNPEGTEINAEIAVGPSAPLGVRVIQVVTPAGSSTRLGTGANLFGVQ